jgi:hypothetical protein
MCTFDGCDRPPISADDVDLECDADAEVRDHIRAHWVDWGHFVVELHYDGDPFDEVPSWMLRVATDNVRLARRITEEIDDALSWDDEETGHAGIETVNMNYRTLVQWPARPRTSFPDFGSDITPFLAS